MATRSYLLVIPWSSHFAGGVNIVVKGLAAALRADTDFEPIIAIETWGERYGRVVGDELLFQFALIGSDRLSARMRALLLLPWRLWRLHRVLTRLNAEVVNFHYVTDAALGVALLKRLGLYHGRYVLSFHGSDAQQPSDLVKKMAYRIILKTADAIVAVSNGLSARVSKEMDIAPTSVSVVLNGTDLNVFRPDATSSSDFVAHVPSEFVLSISSYVPRKNLGCLLRAFANLANRRPSLCLCIAGDDGPELVPLRQQSAELGLTERVRFYVSLQPEDVAHLIARARLVVQTAWSEGLPLAVIEAGAVGTPVAVSDIPGHDELVQDGITGRMFPPDDDAACTLAMEELLSEPSAAQAMADRLRARIVRELTWSSCARNYLEVLGLDARLPSTPPAKTSADSPTD